jgi:pimeloyl-ACP methyl ester carboxylesterase
MEVCVGLLGEETRSNIEEKALESSYSVLCRTLTMAKDALALMDHLGWNNTHVVGHSMGGMIACKLGAMAPERVVSLALISTTGGGYECLPKVLNQKPNSHY